MHAQRWITGIIGFPLVVWLILKGHAALFALLIAVVVTLAMWEYLRLVLPPTLAGADRLIPLLGLISAPAVTWGAYRGGPQLMLAVVVLNLLAAAGIAILRFGQNPAISKRVISQSLGIVYIPVLLSFLVLLRNGSDGALWILMAICLIFAGDTGAYYTGKLWGRHKLCPAVSPKKTVEGAIGGIAANIAVGIVFKIWIIKSLAWWPAVPFFILLGIVGQAGDLFESILKRTAGIKDSGALLPGHGGFLDRIDALLFATPLVYYYHLYLG